eukprot:CAMPEP_0170499032 /NCGR_PEP_ID=MMETSP0208-20121228/29850_1 /TAXON_ID=197538 /ORGANISM="Strombidium inclinatum, Strain S3" /LENGTH=59 /DNA_ID=CAMNT_0010776411 /DNA_START=1 /DNA_END=180 /DNA_ORIENTATION=+
MLPHLDRPGLSGVLMSDITTIFPSCSSFISLSLKSGALLCYLAFSSSSLTRMSSAERES